MVEDENGRNLWGAFLHILTHQAKMRLMREKYRSEERGQRARPGLRAARAQGSREMHPQSRPGEQGEVPLSSAVRPNPTLPGLFVEATNQSGTAAEIAPPLCPGDLPGTERRLFVSRLPESREVYPHEYTLAGFEEH